MFCEAYESGAFGEEELAVTPGGCVVALLECLFNPKPSPKPSAKLRTMAAATMMLPRRDHDLVLLVTSCSPLTPNKGGEGVGDTFWSAITCKQSEALAEFELQKGWRSERERVAERIHAILDVFQAKGQDEGI